MHKCTLLCFTNSD